MLRIGILYMPVPAYDNELSIWPALALILIQATPVQGELVSRVVTIQACGELKHVHKHTLLHHPCPGGARVESSIAYCTEPSRAHIHLMGFWLKAQVFPELVITSRIHITLKPLVYLSVLAHTSLLTQV